MEVHVPLRIDADLVIRLLAGFLADEVGKVGIHDVVFGLSGGVDSAVVAALAARAFPPERIHAVIMPYAESSASSRADAQEVAAQIGITPEVSDITPQIDAYFAGNPEASKMRRGNKMARERMTVLYDQSERYGALVLGTSNKTELLLGYGTIFGDMAHAVNPIGDLYKTQVFALGRALGLPESVLTKAPSADLWEGQSDEADLGFSYARVDALLAAMIDERRERGELLALGFEESFVTDVEKRIRKNQFKRRLPVIAKLGPRTIDRDFRYPRDWGH